MRKLFAIIAVLALLCGPALAEVGLANPWAETTEEELMDQFGLALGVPEDATGVSWRVLEAEQLAEAQFTWQDEDYVARVAPAEAFEDISGVYVAWERQQECRVGRCRGVCYRGQDGENTVELCLWYDELTGLMYSVTVSDGDLDGFDILAAAEELYVPMQTE